MADSDNSTTLSFVTRRKILTGASIAIGASGFNAFANDAIEIDGSSDPVLALWHQWHDAHVLMENHGCRTQSLEQQLAETVDYPCAKIELPDGKSVTAYSLTAIRDIFDGAPDDAADRTRAEAAFAEHQLRWDEADQKIGYSARVKAEHVAADQAANILEVMATTSSTTLAGIEAKLDATLREGTVWVDCSEFPWPQIRSALNDIIRIKQHQASGAPS